MTIDPRRIATLDQLKVELRTALERVEEVEAREPGSVEEVDQLLDELRAEMDRLNQCRKDLEK